MNEQLSFFLKEVTNLITITRNSGGKMTVFLCTAKRYWMLNTSQKYTCYLTNVFYKDETFGNSCRYF